MDVILLERVEKLGAIGDVVSVKNGYARNYLLPNKKALRANAANKAVFEANRERIEKENAEKRDVASDEGKKMDGTELVMIRQASNTGQLYGSVATRDVVAGMEEKGFKVEKSQVQLVRPIKAIGMHDVNIVLHPEVTVVVKANVARSPEEAELQSQGVDIIQQMYEEEQAELRSTAIEAGVDEEAVLEPGEVVNEEGEIEVAEGVEEHPLKGTADEAPTEAEVEAATEEADGDSADADTAEDKSEEE